MKRIRKLVRTLDGASALLAALLAICIAAGCNDYGNTFQNPTGAYISFLSPADATAGGPTFTLTVNSSNGGFVSQTVVQWNGKNLPTTYINAAQVTAQVTATLIANVGTAYVNTLNPHSGAGENGLSNVIAFIINPQPNPVPVVTSMSPTSAVAGSSSFTLMVNGSNFLLLSDPSGGSQVHWNFNGTQTNLPILSITSTQIQATVDSTLLVNSTSQNVTAIVTAYNPPSQQSGSGGSGGGGTSANGLSFTITPGSTNAARTRNVSEETPAISVDGRFVAYAALQSDHAQIFVRDTCEGAPLSCQAQTILVSAASDTSAGNDDSKSPSMSSDGRYVAFSSAATNLVEGAPSGRQIYLRDTCLGPSATASCSPSTQLVSQDSTGAFQGLECILPSLSSTGRFVAFLAVTPAVAVTQSGNPAALQAPAKSAVASTNRQIFVRDTCLGVQGCAPKTTRISQQTSASSATRSMERPAGPAISGSGSQLAVTDASLPVIFTPRSIAIDDHVFLTLISNK